MTVDKSSRNRLLVDLALADSNMRPSSCFEAKHVSTLPGLWRKGSARGGSALVDAPGRASNPGAASLVEPTIDRNVGLIRRHGRELSPAARKLYEMIESTWLLASAHPDA